MIDKTALEQKGFQGFLPFTQQKAGDLSEVPKKPGVYVVVTPEGWKTEFMDHNPGGKKKGYDPTEDRSKLEQKWVDEATVLYIGKVGGVEYRPDRTLNRRIREFINFGTGKSNNHKGGRLIWQLRDAHSLQVAWLPADEPLELENRMLLSFKGTYGKLPFANLRFSKKLTTAIASSKRT
ncbi:MAG: hypothetical protein IH861_12680 [Chloroflexi bacterium]|nr:hypothetical protein [Chloroflexota bacterium]